MGTAKRWNMEKGFGFIIPDRPGADDVFVHAMSLVDTNAIREGARLCFRMDFDHAKGKARAEDVTGGYIDPSRPPPGARSNGGGGGMGGGGYGGAGAYRRRWRRLCRRYRRVCGCWRQLWWRRIRRRICRRDGVRRRGGRRRLLRLRRCQRRLRRRRRLRRTRAALGCGAAPGYDVAAGGYSMGSYNGIPTPGRRRLRARRAATGPRNHR